MKNFIIRAVTGIAFVAVLVGCMLHPYSFGAIFALITAASVWEFCTIINKNTGAKVNRFITTVAGTYLFVAVLMYVVQLSDAKVFIPYLISIMYLMVSELYQTRETPLQSWAYAMMAQMYIALPFASLNAMAMIGTPEGIVYAFWFPLSLFIFLWMNDTGAYCFGSLLGKHRLFPSVSPKKSWEGSIGGAIVAIAASQVIATFQPFTAQMPDMSSRLAWGGMALTVVVFGTWGDLVESLMKRKLGIKDSGSILPGHGGMLDRFDSSLIAIPAALVYIYTISML